MITARSWRAARRTVLPPALLGVAALPWSRRTALLSLGAAGALLAFFRDPSRRGEHAPELIYAPADGRVIALERGERLLIGTFLSLHDVHVNRSPVDGTVVEIDELGGRRLPALLGAAATDNRRNVVRIESAHGTVTVVQIAGALARRISRWIEPGDGVAAGQRIGLIHLGSRTDVLLPGDRAEPLIAPGARVRAGVTPVARWRSTAP